MGYSPASQSASAPPKRIARINAKPDEILPLPLPLFTPFGRELTTMWFGSNDARYSIEDDSLASHPVHSIFPECLPVGPRVAESLAEAQIANLASLDMLDFLYPFLFSARDTQIPVTI